MKKFKYKVGPDGTELIRLSDAQKIPLPEINLRNYGGERTQLDIGTDGKIKTISRRSIDETDYQLGPPAVYKKKRKAMGAHVEPPTVPTQQLTVVKREQFVEILKEELVNIHQTLQAAADATQRLLVRLILQS